MKSIIFLAALFCSLTACVAQNKTLNNAQQGTQQSITLQHDSIPASTVVPVIQPTYGVNDTINRATELSHMTRTERRARRAHDYAFHIDSLVATRAFAFYPTLMQAMPAGEIEQVYADYFYIFISPVDLEVHMPIEHGVSQQPSILNFDTDGIENYTAVKYIAQWNISFTAKDDGIEYGFALDISTITGRTELTIEYPKGMMQYVGSIGKRMRERR